MFTIKRFRVPFGYSVKGVSHDLMVAAEYRLRPDVLRKTDKGGL
jgi:hypothetical protein